MLQHCTLGQGGVNEMLHTSCLLHASHISDMLLLLRTFFRQPSRCCFHCCLSGLLLYCVHRCIFRIKTKFFAVVRLYSVAWGVPAMPPTARMTPDEKAIARDMHERGIIPSHIADHLGRAFSCPDRMCCIRFAPHSKNRLIPQILLIFIDPDTENRLIPLISIFLFLE